MIKKKVLREKIQKKGYRIGNSILNEIARKFSFQLDGEIERIIRNAKVSGRKTIKKEDFS